MTTLAWNRYGKSRVRLVKVRRARDAHDIVDLTVDVQLEGAFDAVYVDGDNGPCLATDTMKNTVYAIARTHPIEHVESFASRLAEHFAAGIAGFPDAVGDSSDNLVAAAASEIKLDGQEYLILREDEILGIIETAKGKK